MVKFIDITRMSAPLQPHREVLCALHPRQCLGPCQHRGGGDRRHQYFDRADLRSEGESRRSNVVPDGAHRARAREGAIFESIAVQFFLRTHYERIASFHAVLAFYGLIWLLGDYQAIKKSVVTLSATELHVHIGMRWDFFIPIAEIKGAELGEPKELRAPTKIKMGEFVSKIKIPGYEIVTVTGRPNMYLTLRRPITITGLFGRKKTMERIGLGIDSANDFVTRVSLLK
jgi:hypothetical protein